MNASAGGLPVDESTGEVDITRLSSAPPYRHIEVHRAMAAVQTELSKIGIAKTRQNEQQKYMYRGIDEAYAVVAPLFSQYGLLMIPRVNERIVTERISKDNKALFVVTVKAEYDFVAVVDGSSHTVGPFWGEAMDSGDKATQKAMSAAHKYAIFETFCVPVQGSPDADGDNHEVQSELPAEQQAALAKLRGAAMNGQKAFDAAWAGIGKENRVALMSQLDSLKQAAAQAQGATGGA